MPLSPFRDLRDPDEKRREIVWIAISFIVILASWLSVVLVFGYQPLLLGMTYDEMVLSTGLCLLVFCTILYLGAREREQRAANKTLVAQLQGAVASLDERVDQLNGLSTTSAELAGALDVDQISHCVVDSVLSALGADGAYLVLLDREDRQPLYVHCSPPAATLQAGLDSLDPELNWNSAPSRGREGGEATFSVEPWNDERTLLRASLHLTGGLVGVLAARRTNSARPFTGDDLRVLSTLANMTVKAIETAHLQSELRESYLATVRSLVNSLHERDHYTASHGTRVAALATGMAEYLGLPDNLVHDIEVFGPLHDVGKIGIRDGILLKPGPLSDEERAICREHCVIGERILRPLRPSRDALGMVRNHHESWDGRGYPDGLMAEEIPVLARLLQVADSYDAMISDRPYQTGMSEQEVLSHFRQQGGRLYDPVAVKALCAVASGAALRDESAVDGLGASQTHRTRGLPPAQTERELAVSGRVRPEHRGN